MHQFLSIMAAPMVMAFILVGIHAYLGLHVVSRGVIFVDIALAQVAALGTALAILMGAEIGTPRAYALGLAMALVGAAVFAATRQRKEQVPQEAFIGITYAVAASTMTLLLSRAPHGAEEAESLLVGQILWVPWSKVLHTAGIYAVIGLLHYLFRKPFLEVSLRPAEAFARGRRVRLWDFLFYGTVALVVTSSVQVAGVLLVFALLVVPAVMGVLMSSSLKGRLIFGWVSGVVVCFAGSLASYHFDLPTGPAIVSLFGLALVSVWLARLVLRRGNRIAAVADGASALQLRKAAKD